MREVPKLTEEEERLLSLITKENGFSLESAANRYRIHDPKHDDKFTIAAALKAFEHVPESLGDFKRNAVMAASQQVDPSVDAREAFGFMPMSLKGAAIRWRGL